MDPTSTNAGFDPREFLGCTCLRTRRAARRMTQLYDQALAPVGLTITQFGVLAYLEGFGGEAGEGLSIGGLAERLGMDPTTLNRALKPLESCGLAASAPDPRDGRVRGVRLTRAGAARLREAAPLWRRAQARLDRELGRETVLALNGLLDLSTAKLRA